VNRAVLPFPTLPDKTEADIRKIADRLRAEPEAYCESRRHGGVTLERAYWQHTPMGDLVVAYLESEKTVGETLASTASDPTDLGRWFAATVKEVHGVDITQPPTGPEPETLAVWSDPDVKRRKRGMAFSAPGLPDAVEKGRAFAKEAFGSEGMTRSRRALGENLEVVTLTQTPQGPVICVYLEGDDPFDANPRFAASQDPFDV
jgi:hypothetical protein